MAFDNQLPIKEIRGQIRLNFYEDDKLVNTEFINNLLVRKGVRGSMKCLFTPDEYIHLNRVKFGTSGDAASKYDTNLQAPVSERYGVPIDRQEINEQFGAYSCALDFSLDENAMNGRTIRELGLFFSDGTMFARHALKSNVVFSKQRNMSVAGTWFIFVVKPDDDVDTVSIDPAGGEEIEDPGGDDGGINYNLSVTFRSTDISPEVYGPNNNRVIWISPAGDEYVGTSPSSDYFDETGEYEINFLDESSVKDLLFGDESVREMDFSYLQYLDNLESVYVQDNNINYRTGGLENDGGFVSITDSVHIEMQNSDFEEEDTDHVLEDLDNTGAVSGYLDISGTNTYPSETGLDYVSSLRDKDWTIILPPLPFEPWPQYKLNPEKTSSADYSAPSSLYPLGRKKVNDPDDSFYATYSIIFDDSYVYSNVYGSVHKLDPWSLNTIAYFDYGDNYDSGIGYMAPVYDDGYVYAIVDEDPVVIVKLDASDMTLVTQNTYPGVLGYSNDMAYYDGVLYHSAGGVFYAIDTSDMSIINTVDSGEHPSATTVPMVYGNSVYIGANYSSTVAALERWTLDLSTKHAEFTGTSGASSTPSVMNGDIYYGASNEYFRLDSDTLDVIDSFSSDDLGLFRRGSGPSPWNNTHVFHPSANYGYRFSKLNVDCSPDSHYNTGDQQDNYSPVIGDKVYGASSSFTYVFDANDFSVIDKIPYGHSNKSPVAGNGSLYQVDDTSIWRLGMPKVPAVLDDFEHVDILRYGWDTDYAEIQSSVTSSGTYALHFPDLNETYDDHEIYRFDAEEGKEPGTLGIIRGFSYTLDIMGGANAELEFMFCLQQHEVGDGFDYNLDERYSVVFNFNYDELSLYKSDTELETTSFSFSPDTWYSCTIEIERFVDNTTPAEIAVYVDGTQYFTYSRDINYGYKSGGYGFRISGNGQPNQYGYFDNLRRVETL